MERTKANGERAADCDRIAELEEVRARRIVECPALHWREAADPARRALCFRRHAAYWRAVDAEERAAATRE